MALGASIIYTAYILVSSRILKSVSGELASFCVMGAAGLSFLVSGSLAGRIHVSWSFQAWVWVLLIATVSTTVAITAFLQGVKIVGPSRASILSTIEPATALVAASLLFSDFLNAYQCVGGVLILIAAITAGYSRKAPGD
jgi:drug/metabolite transporter (DMT)-like permease